MEINQSVLDKLTRNAKESQRLRKNFDLRDSDEDNSQRMLNAIEPGTELPIHRHTSTSETCIIIRGCAEEFFFDDNGNLTGSIVLKPNSDCVGVQIPVGKWHRIIAKESGTVIFEAKDGRYEPVSSNDILTISQL